jgi:DNA-binding MarR family transcriptional regulator
MSSGTQEQRAELLGSLAQEFTQFNGLSAAFFRAVASRIGVTVTDMQVIESLASTGPSTAGQLAELTGLTTGAITGMLNRLEEAGLVRRERDPEDGRKVIVRINPDSDQMRGLGAILNAVHKVWEEQTAHYDDEQIAFLVDFLKRANAVAKQEILWLREPPQADVGAHSSPLGDLTSARLVIPSGVPVLKLRASADLATLYRAAFEGPMPDVKVKDGVVTIRYARRLWGLAGLSGSAEVTLNAAIPWYIAIQGGSSMITAELAGLNLAGLEVKGGGSMIRLELPVPLGQVPIQISGGGSQIEVLRPQGVAARARLKGWGSAVTFDDQGTSTLGNDMPLQTPNYAATAPGYDIEVSSSGSMVTITTQ